MLLLLPPPPPPLRLHRYSSPCRNLASSAWCSSQLTCHFTAWSSFRSPNVHLEKTAMPCAYPGMSLQPLHVPPRTHMPHITCRMPMTYTVSGPLAIYRIISPCMSPLRPTCHIPYRVPCAAPERNSAVAAGGAAPDRLRFGDREFLGDWHGPRPCCGLWHSYLHRIPMPKRVCRTCSSNEGVQCEVCRTCFGRGMRMNIAAHAGTPAGRMRETQESGFQRVWLGKICKSKGWNP